MAELEHTPKPDLDLDLNLPARNTSCSYLTKAQALAKISQGTPTCDQNAESKSKVVYIAEPNLIKALESCMIVKDIAMKMAFPTRTYCTAQQILYKVYAMGLQNQADQVDLAVCALLVSSKMEETIKKLKDLVSKAYFAAQLDDSSSFTELEMENKRKQVLKCENIILKSINFDFNTSETHSYYVKFTKFFNVERSICEDGWLLLNDSFQTILSLQFPPLVFIISSLFISSNLHNPDSSNVSFKVFLSCITNIKSDGSTLLPRKPSEENSKKIYETIKQEFKNFSDRQIDLSTKWWTRFSIFSDELIDFTTQMLNLYIYYPKILRNINPDFMKKHSFGCVSSSIEDKIYKFVKSMKS